VLPRDRWPVFLATPATLLRWHRDLLARRWTYPHTGNRHTLPEDTVDLVIRLAQENLRWGY
jgi:putative transposase